MKHLQIKHSQSHLSPLSRELTSNYTLEANITVSAILLLKLTN